MSTDIEQELRELFRDKAGEAPATTPDVAAGAPERVLRRARRRQLATVAGSATIAFAIVVGSVAGLNAVLRGTEDRDVGTDDPSTLTVTIEPFTITSPDGWYLVNHWPGSLAADPGGGSPATVLRLSNVDLGLGTDGCPGYPLPAEAAVLTISFTGGHVIDADPDGPWPADFRVSTLADGCGPGRIGRFTVAGWGYAAWYAFGEAVDEADRAELLRAVDSIDVQPSWEPPLNPLGELPAYVVAAGEHGPGDPWRLDLRPAGEALELTLEGRGGEILTADATAAPLAWSGTDPVFGVVAEGAGEVAFQPGSENVAYDLGGTPVAGTLVDVPPTLDTFGLDLFVIDLPAGQAGLAGRVLVDGRSTSPTESVFPDGTPRTDAVELIGSDLGHPWSVRFTGAFADRTACIAVTIDDETFDPHCPRPRLFLAGGRPNLSGWVTPSLHLLAGTVPLEVVGIDFVSDTPDQPLASARCEPGPAGWTDPDRRVCVAVLAAEGSGTVRYLGAEGEVVFEEPMAWDAGPAVDIPTPVQPTHGGTYWAVYAWLGAPGDPEADEVSDRLLADFGIEAFPGDLACDQGATEAVGAEYSWRVAVYFGSEEDAQVFAKRTGLLDAGPWESVVRVTTYCLD